MLSENSTRGIARLISNAIPRFLQKETASRSHRNHKILSEEQAVEIYKEKLAFLRKPAGTRCKTESLRGKSTVTSSKFYVSPKTVRDIWNRRTWQHATSFLWSYEESDDFCIETRVHYGKNKVCAKHFDTSSIVIAWKCLIFPAFVTIYKDCISGSRRPVCSQQSRN